jgi:hypothetical protein
MLICRFPHTNCVLQNLLPTLTIDAGLMACSTLVTVVYDPTQNAQSRQIERSRALSHAAKVSHRRRRADRRGVGPIKPDQDWLLDNPSSGRRMGPLTTLNRGNSDPFNTTAISVTPEIAMLLASWIAHYETNIVSPTRKLSATTSRQDMALGNELQMSSLLLACQTLRLVQSSHHESMQVQTLQRKVKAFEQLGNVGTVQPGPEIVPYIKALAHVFIASVLVNEVHEARLHEAQLRQALASVQGAPFWTRQNQNLLISRVYYYDQRAALVYMHPPVLEPDIIDQFWEVFPDPVQRWLQQRSSSQCIAGISVLSQGVKIIFRRLQDHIDILCHGMPELSSELDEHAISGPVLYSNHLTFMVFNHLKVAQSRSTMAIERKARHVWTTESVLTLAALTFLASAVNGPTVVSMYQRGRRAAQGLQTSLTRLWHDTACDPSSWILRYSQLWALYIGATWEWESGEYNKANDWFTTRLQEKIREYNLESWNGLMEIADSFLSVPARRNPGSIWLLGMADPPGESRCSRGDIAISQTLEEVLFPN